MRLLKTVVAALDAITALNKTFLFAWVRYCCPCTVSHALTATTALATNQSSTAASFIAVMSTSGSCSIMHGN
jgi:hypothetical protein